MHSPFCRGPQLLNSEKDGINMVAGPWCIFPDSNRGHSLTISGKKWMNEWKNYFNPNTMSCQHLCCRYTFSLIYLFCVCVQRCGGTQPPNSEMDDINISANTNPEPASVYTLWLWKMSLDLLTMLSQVKWYFIWVLRQPHTRGGIKGQTSRALKKSGENKLGVLFSQLSCEGTLWAYFKESAEGTVNNLQHGQVYITGRFFFLFSEFVLGVSQIIYKKGPNTQRRTGIFFFLLVEFVNIAADFDEVL